MKYSYYKNTVDLLTLTHIFIITVFSCSVSLPVMDCRFFTNNIIQSIGNILENIALKEPNVYLKMRNV